MSEEKLYAVKNDEGEWLNQYCLWGPETWATPDKDDLEKVAKHYGGHVVAFVEEPKKVVLSKEEAKIVEDAHNDKYPASYISGNNDGERFLMEAFVNGYTVAKEKKYKVRVPETQTSYYYKGSDGHVHASDTSGGLDNEFSDYELQQYGLDGERFTKEEVTDDEQ
ncbi:DUF1642 domain-containing protein [Lacticaseibacillus paracasei]|uniref:DUF1642 domain-containing protein n=1 Tax=Lacticaseibacillus paracasei TaxID=1597 RepID=UPI001C4582CC|nr:DUF1642 domain-containing protein [Lacticaseibacillus paracasei]QXJ68204.1 DUF1642 domain-containing protein [Lacticaseibacillus paracasei subsp. paracasei]